MSAQYTAADVIALAADTQAVLPVTAFGLTVRLEDHPPAEAWAQARLDVPDPVDVDVTLVRYSTQDEGVLACVLADVIANGTHTAPRDPEGWFANPHPLLFAWPDGTYTVRDGNHRIIGAILRGDATIRAHVIAWDRCVLDNSPTACAGELVQVWHGRPVPVTACQRHVDENLDAAFRAALIAGLADDQE